MDVAQTLFGPLGKKYCIWFYILSIIPFIAIVLLVARTLYISFSKRGGNLESLFTIIPVVVIYLIAYFQNRLLYSMCSGLNA
jgi:hypothetical protein